MTNQIVGYHGTNSDNLNSITTNNFQLSENPNDWLGFGVYFFVDGISCPIDNAREWAINQAYQGGCYSYERFSVLSANVNFERMLNTNELDHIKAFNTARNSLIAKHNKEFGRNRVFEQDNRLLWNLVADHMKLDIVIHNLYIKNKMQRIKKIDSNVPNTTVMCVKKSGSIDTSTILEVLQGDTHGH